MMELPPEPITPISSSLYLSKLPRWLAAFTLATLLVIPVRYAFRLIPPERLVIGNRLMAPGTLLPLILLCILLLWFHADTSDKGRASTATIIANIIAWAVFISGFVLWLSNIVWGADVLSPIITRLVFRLPDATGGQTTMATAASIMLIGAAQCLRTTGRLTACRLTALVQMLISGSAILGYAYGAHELYTFGILNTLALHTSLALFALSLATLIAQPTNGWFRPLASLGPGGVTARRLVIFALILPFMGWLLVGLVADRTVDFRMGFAVLVIVMVAPMIGLILHVGTTQDRLAAENHARERANTHFAQALERRLDEQATSLRHESAERQKAESAMFRAQRMEAVGQLTGGIAHDFNNLLMAISASHFLLKQSIDVHHAGYKYLANASAATSRGEKLTSQLMSFSRTQRLDIHATELQTVIDFTLAMVTNALGPQIELRCHVHDHNVYVLTDANQFEMGLLNVALNARDAMPDGGVFTIATSKEVLDTETGAQAFISIKISDTGHGMPPEVAARAGEPFFTTKAQGSGTGLGLAQVYGFVKQSGGQFRLESALGVGTTVEILLPEASPPPPTDGPQTDSIEHPLNDGSKTLLLIDDDENVRAALGEVLRGEGYVVLEASNGQMGLDLLETVEPSTAIIDFIMPGLNGAETARLARNKIPDLPIIFVSGYADTLALDRISNAVVLRKPVEINRLLKAVEVAS